MAFHKYSNCPVLETNVSPDKWVKNTGSKTGNIIIASDSTLLGQYPPDKFLLSHATIISSVMVEDDGVLNEDGIPYHIVPECNVLVNNNGDSWENELLLNTYKTFIGGHNFLEHVQMEHLSKGRIIDAAIRFMPVRNSSESSNGKDIYVYYVDILVATDRAKDPSLVQKIASGELKTMSMGSSVAYTICTKCGNKAQDSTTLCTHIKYAKCNFWIDSQGKKRIIGELCLPWYNKVLMGDCSYKYIEDVGIGDEIVTHTGKIRKVLKTFRNSFDSDLVRLKIEGGLNTIDSTPEHPHYVYNFETKSFSFKKASEIQIGDFLCKTAPTSHKGEGGNSANKYMTLGKAWLLGLYAAEGTKDKLYNKISFHLNGIDEDYLAELIRSRAEEEFPGAHIELRKYLRSANELNGTYKIKTDNGKTRIISDCVSKKFIVEVRSAEAWEFFTKYCKGDRSWNKKLDANVFRINKCFQKEILEGWLVGDGTMDGFQRMSGTTTSENLYKSFELLATRLGIWNRGQIYFDGKFTTLAELRKIHKQTGNFVDSKGWHPRFSLYLSPRSKLVSEIAESAGFIEKFPHKNKEIRRINGYNLHKVTEVSTIPYSGYVYNLNVEDHNSFIIDGIVTHNCGSKNDLTSNRFFEASWVSKPAFEGAALRNILNLGQLDLKNNVTVVNPQTIKSPYQSMSQFTAAALESPLLNQFLKSAAIIDPDDTPELIEERDETEKNIEYEDDIPLDIFENELRQQDSLVEGFCQKSSDDIREFIKHNYKVSNLDYKSWKKLHQCVSLIKSGVSISELKSLGFSPKETFSVSYFIRKASNQENLNKDIIPVLLELGNYKSRFSKSAYLKEIQSKLNRKLNENEKKLVVAQSKFL